MGILDSEFLKEEEEVDWEWEKIWEEVRGGVGNEGD